MRKVVLLFILFVFSLSRADAQEFHFIPRIGLNLANTYPESFADMRPGLNIGVAEEIRFSKLFALEPGVYYSMQGYQKENAKGETARLKADYLNIPIYAKFYLYRGFHLFAGPQVGFNVRAKASHYVFVSGPTPVHQSEYDFSGDKKEEIRNCDFSVSMGLGYTFDMGLVISANYNLGCTHFFREPEYSLGGSNHFRGKDHNGVIQFNLGWRF